MSKFSIDSLSRDVRASAFDFIGAILQVLRQPGQQPLGGQQGHGEETLVAADRKRRLCRERVRVELLAQERSCLVPSILDRGQSSQTLLKNRQKCGVNKQKELISQRQRLLL